jgi:hypothetical protein
MHQGAFRMRSLALFAASALVLAVSATVLADSPNPDSTVNAQVNGLTVTLSGTWQWTRNCNSGTLDQGHNGVDGPRDAGVAVDWGDPSAAGNEVVTGLEVGTPSDNLVHLRAPADQGTCSGGDISSGAWGPISHTYAEAGEYSMCAVVYDVRLADTPASGHLSLVAGGVNHNDDNSAEENSFESGVQCVKTTIVVATPIPVQSVEAGTGTPAQSQADTALSQNGGSPLPTIAFSLLLLASLATLAYANVKTVRARNRS